MELDELKTAWREMNETRFARIENELRLRRTRTDLRRFAIAPIFELAVGAFGPLLVGSFLANGPHQARFVIPGVFLMIAAIAMLPIAIWQIAAVGRIDYSRPIVEVQKQIAAIRIFRIRTTQWTLVLAPALWMPLATVAFMGLFRVDVYRTFGVPYVMANLAFGLLAAPVLYWIGRSVGRRYQGTDGMRRLLDSIGGDGLSRAMRDLDETAEFARAL